MADILARDIDYENAYERLPDGIPAYLVRLVDGGYRVEAERDALLSEIASDLRAEFDRRAAEIDDARTESELADEFGEPEGIKAASFALHELMRERWPEWRDVYDKIPKVVLIDLAVGLTDRARADALGRARSKYLASWARPYRWLLARFYGVLHTGRCLLLEVRNAG